MAEDNPPHNIEATVQSIKDVFSKGLIPTQEQFDFIRDHPEFFVLPETPEDDSLTINQINDFKNSSSRIKPEAENTAVFVGISPLEAEAQSRERTPSAVSRGILPIGTFKRDSNPQVISTSESKKP